MVSLVVAKAIIKAYLARKSADAADKILFDCINLARRLEFERDTTRHRVPPPIALANELRAAHACNEEYAALEESKRLTALALYADNTLYAIKMAEADSI